jgi:hypothetical protein
VAVREFSGATGDDIICATGALAGFTHGTIAVIIKRSVVSNYRPLFNPHNAAGTALGSFLVWRPNNTLSWFKDAARSGGSTSLAVNTWYLLVARKPQGSVAARFSLYNFTAASWVHEIGGASVNDWIAPGSDGSIRFTYETELDNLDGRIAVRGAWANTLPWSADSTGDASLEAAGLEISLQNWLTASPTALWAFNQDSITTPVADLTGGGADQTSIIGTSVVTTDDPPGFSFALPRWRRGDGVILRPFVKTSGGLVELT